MARLRDIKVGQSVWIKKGKTPLEVFSSDNDAAISATIGTKGRVLDTDSEDPDCTVRVSFGMDIWWYPVDWISLTPPVNESGRCPGTPLKDKVVKKLYVAHHTGDTTNPGTLDEVVEYMKNEWGYDDADVCNVTFYECTKVDVQYTPAKYTVKG